MNSYFDHNATTPLHPAAREAWLEMADRSWQNPSSLYRDAGAAKQRLEDCRERAADLIGCDPEQLLFLSGATEANNALIAHAVAAGWETIALSALEHPSLLEPARHVFGDRLLAIPVHASGIVDLAALDEILTVRKPRLAALMAANNETGVIQPWQEAQALCRRHGVPFHCDASQWIGKMPAAGLGVCDFITGSAHKFGGPKGTGFLKVPASGRPLRWLRGGPQEGRQRGGTEDLPGIAAMLAAWEAREPTLTASSGFSRLEMRTQFENEILRHLPGATIAGAESPRLWNTVLLTIPPPVNVKWLVRLSGLGFAVSTGSACSRGAGASEVLHAMGWPEESSSQVLRISSGWETTPDDWLALAGALMEVSSQMVAKLHRP
jgi:cysteine desulfurase